MKRLTLNLNALEVQSFATAPHTPDRGTVHGQQQCTCYTCTCPNCFSCAATCPASCYNTCDDLGCRTREGANTCDPTCDFTCATMYCACEP
jgi:hypothetical protein